MEEGKSVFVGAVLSAPVTRDSLKARTSVQLGAISLSMEDGKKRVRLRASNTAKVVAEAKDWVPVVDSAVVVIVGVVESTSVDELASHIAICA